MRLSHHRSKLLGALYTCQSGQEVGARSHGELAEGVFAFFLFFFVNHRNISFRIAMEF